MSGFVMIYDDEPSFARGFPRLLEEFDVPALGFSDYQEALDYLASDGPPPSVLIADKSFARINGIRDIPGAIRERWNVEAGDFGASGGFAVIRLAKKIHPEMRIILSTGEDNLTPVASKLNIWGYIHKPVDPILLKDVCILGDLHPDELDDLIDLESEEFRIRLYGENGGRLEQK